MGSEDKTNNRDGEVIDIIRKIVELTPGGGYIYRGQPNIAHRAVTSTLYRAMNDAVNDAMNDAVKDEVNRAVKDAMKGVTSDVMNDVMKNAVKNAVKNAIQNVIKNVVKKHGKGFEGADWLDMNQVQKEELKVARRFDRRFKDKDDDNVEVLSRIQHYSGDTNLIDFTRDCLVALFFACSEEYDESDGADGVVFWLKVSDLDEKEIKMITPVHPPNRVTAQKSVFIQPRTGAISADADIIKSVQIPLKLKQSILAYLEAHHDISLSNIYNDLHGYIRNRKAHSNVVKEFYLGLNYSYKHDNAQLLKEKKDAAEKAMKHYNKVIRLDPKYMAAYNNRGNAKLRLGDESGAISDYDKAIVLNPDDAIAYHNRGNVKRKYGNAKLKLSDMPGAVSDYKDAIRDHDKAIALNPVYANAYNSRGNVKLDCGDIKWKLDDESGAINDYKDAIRDHDKAIDLNPNDAGAYYNRGLAKEQLGDRQNLQQALSDLEKAKELALQQDRQDVMDDVQERIERVTVRIAGMGEA